MIFIDYIIDAWSIHSCPESRSTSTHHLIINTHFWVWDSSANSLKLYSCSNKVNISVHISSLKVGNSLKVCVSSQLYVTYHIYTTYMVAALSEPLKSRPNNATKDVLALTRVELNTAALRLPMWSVSPAPFRGRVLFLACTFGRTGSDCPVLKCYLWALFLTFPNLPDGVCGVPSLKEELKSYLLRALEEWSDFKLLQQKIHFLRSSDRHHLHSAGLVVERPYPSWQVLKADIDEHLLLARLQALERDLTPKITDSKQCSPLCSVKQIM